MVARFRSPGPCGAPRGWTLDPTTLVGRSGHALSQGCDGSRDVAAPSACERGDTGQDKSEATEVTDRPWAPRSRNAPPWTPCGRTWHALPQGRARSCAGGTLPRPIAGTFPLPIQPKDTPKHKTRQAASCFCSRVCVFCCVRALLLLRACCAASRVRPGHEGTLCHRHE